MNTQKNYTLELMKLFASYMVVFIHVMFYGETGMVIDALARFAVPLFFLISGYYSFHIQPQKIIKRIRNILTLFIFASVCYSLYNTMILLFVGDIGAVGSYFGKYLDVKTLIKFFVFNIPVSSLHLWFLPALIYVYVIFYIATLIHFNEKVEFIIAFSLLFLHILLGEFLSTMGVVVSIPIVRNFVLMGIPFFGLGLFAKKHENKLRNIPNSVIIIACATGIFESLISRYFIGKNELYFGSLLIVFAMVAVFIKYPTVKYPPFFNALFGCSTYIYIFHVMISAVLVSIYDLFSVNYQGSVALQYVHPLIVCVISTIMAYGIVRLLKFFHQKNKKQNFN